MNAAERKREQAERAGCLSLRKVRQTGTIVGVYKNSEAFLDDEEPYSCVCEDHGSILSASSQRLAMQHSADPSTWCDGCRGDDTREQL